METSFHYDLAQKELNFKLREVLTCKPGLELKANGYFNTATGGLAYRGSLKANVSAGQAVKGSLSTPLKLGVGVAVDSAAFVPGAPIEPVLTGSAKKSIALLDDKRTKLTAKAVVDYDPKSEALSRKGSLKLSHKMMNFSKRQDIKLTVGVDAELPQGSKQVQQVPFFQVKENNWAVNFRRNRWFVTYDL